MAKVICILLLLIFMQNTLIAQKCITFQEAETMKLIPQLDSLYKSGIDSDSTKSVFKNTEQYRKAYQKILIQLAQFLAKNNFKWGKQVRCFNRIYFSQKGMIDYFIFDIKDEQITDTQKVRFKELVQQFSQTAQFDLHSIQKFSQCSPVKYADL
ncbi:MAG: hypothetical protein MUF58_00240 [Arcicella sp.]|jgi:hypothetical protein|nr:hypothetical protein [Arcicella sp.]